MGMQQQMGFAAAALMAEGATTDKGKLPDKFIHQAIKEVVMHEVGHTLGLRHNFKASSWKSLDEINKLPIDSDEATVASVMDYSPANIAAKKENQGPYYSADLGALRLLGHRIRLQDRCQRRRTEKNRLPRRRSRAWIIRPTRTPAPTIPTRSPTASTWAKTRSTSPASKWRCPTKLMEKVLERSVEDGDGYQRARQAFGLLLSEYWRTAFFAARFPGGVHVHRDHKGDPKQRPPFEVVNPKDQRDAMKLLAETAFGTPDYDPKLLNHLAASRWSHWGMNSLSRLDYPIHDIVGMMQGRLLSQLLSGLTLTRLHDSELKIADGRMPTRWPSIYGWW